MDRNYPFKWLENIPTRKEQNTKGLIEFFETLSLVFNIDIEQPIIDIDRDNYKTLLTWDNEEYLFNCEIDSYVYCGKFYIEYFYRDKKKNFHKGGIIEVY
jgi:hypothetical protein